MEKTHTSFEIDGEIPTELNGLYVRNGPNPAGKIGNRAHYFSGDGMVHGIYLQEGSVRWYRNRFVRAGDVPKILGESDPGGPVTSNLDVSPNTNIVKFGDTLFATIEAGPSLVEISAELETVRRSDLNGVLDKGFTGHHKIDPRDGDIHGSRHPASRAIRSKAQRLGVSILSADTCREVSGRGVEATLRDDTIRIGRASWLKACGVDGVSDDERTGVWVAKNDRAIGFVSLFDQAKSEAASMGIRRCPKTNSVINRARCERLIHEFGAAVD